MLETERVVSADKERKSLTCSGLPMTEGDGDGDDQKPICIHPRVASWVIDI